MVLTNKNELNIKNHHMLKCLERKKDLFNVYVVPLTKPIDRIDQYDKGIIDIVGDTNIIVESKHSSKYTK
jgi:hypothetical protein